MRLIEVEVDCECGWSGTVGDMTTLDADGYGDDGFGCPECCCVLTITCPEVDVIEEQSSP